MSQQSEPLSAALLALPETTASTIFGMFDIFASVGRDWGFLIDGVPGPSKIRPLIVAPTRDGFNAANGAFIRPDSSFTECRSPDLICIPDLFVMPGEEIDGRFREIEDWLRSAYASGATIAAACSGALLLAEAGLLDNQEATTHWAYCTQMRDSYPAVTVHDARALVASGEGQRILTSGGGTSWQDMALFLVARFCGQEEAMHIARLYLIEWHRIGQLPYASLAGARQISDRVVADSQTWLADHYGEAHAVSAMVERSGLAERSFKRRFSRATGMSPIDYVHTLRIEESKQILETTDLPIEAIAAETGYEDASFFRRLFRRKVGISPSAYRKQFRGIRQALSAAGGDHRGAVELVADGRR